MIRLLPIPFPPLQWWSSTGDTQEDGERESTCWRERGGGATSCDGEKAWSSMNHSIFSSLYLPTCFTYQPAIQYTYVTLHGVRYIFQLLLTPISKHNYSIWVLYNIHVEHVHILTHTLSCFTNTVQYSSRHSAFRIKSIWIRLRKVHLILIWKLCTVKRIPKIYFQNPNSATSLPNTKFIFPKQIFIILCGPSLPMRPKARVLALISVMPYTSSWIARYTQLSSSCQVRQHKLRFDVSLSDFDLYIFNKYLFIPLLVLCIPILWGPALQCGYVMFEHRRCFGVRRSSVGRQGVGLQL